MIGSIRHVVKASNISKENLVEVLMFDKFYAVKKNQSCRLNFSYGHSVSGRVGCLLCLFNCLFVL